MIDCLLMFLKNHVHFFKSVFNIMGYSYFNNNFLYPHYHITIYIIQDDCYSSVTLSKTERKMLVKHYADMKNEMSIDTKQLSERNQLKLLQATKQALERKLAQVVDTNRGLEKRVADEKHALDQLTGEAKAVRAEIRQIDALIEKEDKG